MLRKRSLKLCHNQIKTDFYVNLMISFRYFEKPNIHYDGQLRFHHIIKTFVKRALKLSGGKKCFPEMCWKKNIKTSPDGTNDLLAFHRIDFPQTRSGNIVRVFWIVFKQRLINDVSAFISLSTWNILFHISSYVKLPLGECEY